MSGSLFVGHCYGPSAQNTAQEPQKRLLTPTMGIRPWTLHSIDDVCVPTGCHRGRTHPYLLTWVVSFHPCRPRGSNPHCGSKPLPPVFVGKDLSAGGHVNPDMLPFCCNSSPDGHVRDQPRC